MTRLILITFLVLLSHINFAQVDTVYVDDIDTVVVEQGPVVVTKTVYHKERTPRTNTKKNFSMLPSTGFLWDISNYEVCEECKEEFKKLRSSYSYTNVVQYGLLLSYYRKKVSLGLDINYRQASRKINYSDSSLVLQSTVKASYFLIGPSVGYKVINKKIWDLDLTVGVLFSFTTEQSGQMITGERIDTITDLKTTPYIAKENFLYHFSPIITIKASNSLGITLAPHYYFDHFSNVINQSYTEQRNSVGVALGIKYSF